MKNWVRTSIGAVAWLAFVIYARIAGAADAWAHAAVLLVPLVLLPLVLELLTERRDSGKINRWLAWTRRFHLPAGIVLAISYGLTPGLYALLAAIPWAAVTVLLTAVGLGRMMRDGFSRPVERLSGDVGMMYLTLGGLWLLAERTGLRPAGFEPGMVGLAAVIFNVYGLLLPIMAGMVLRQMPESRSATRGVVGVVLGIPAVVVGLTASALGWTPAIEAAGGCGLALAAMGIAVLQIRIASDARGIAGWARLAVAVSGVALFFAMVLVAAYSIRGYAVLFPWLGNAAMQSLSGMLGALGFGLCGLVGWPKLRQTG